ncbi:MAG: hypothetical protein K6G61_06935 [Solobacterium sp.]|nr:hypothetical protein [Solobacterium sp.]
MLTTVMLAMIMMAGLFLLLYAGVGLIREKKFFTSAPQAVQDAVREGTERFPGAHALGWLLAAFAVVLLIGPLICGAMDGIAGGFGFLQFFGRFLFMLWGLKAYDILFFDWYLLCRSGFFPHFYPEVKPLLGPHLFGYNRNTHMFHILASPVLAAVLAWICTLL